MQDLTPNVFEPELKQDEDDPPGFRALAARVVAPNGNEHLGATVYELPRGEALCPYHWHEANEEMAIALSGNPSVRTPHGWRELGPGDVVSFRRGPEGAHQIANRSDTAARVLMVSEMNSPEVVFYPDSNKVSAMTKPPGRPRRESDVVERFNRGDAVDYWEGERPPEAT
jgi:uncharacterized cupin superfamily protein